LIIVIGTRYYGDPLRQIDNVVPLTSSKKRILRDPSKISLVLFTGGADVHPSFYKGIDASNVCGTNIERDVFEKKIFEYCRRHNIKMTGICRGFQFLNVMAGGFMYQHIKGHTGAFHNTYFPYNSTVLEVTSTHHQLVGLPSGSAPIAWAHPSRSGFYIGPLGKRVKPPGYEAEAAVFPNINAMGVQYHPEMLKAGNPCRTHYTSMISDFVRMNMNEFANKYGRRTVYDRNREAGHTRRED